jgi:hypothetical protein
MTLGYTTFILKSFCVGNIWRNARKLFYTPLLYNIFSICIYSKQPEKPVRYVEIKRMHLKLGLLEQQLSTLCYLNSIFFIIGGMGLSP